MRKPIFCMVFILTLIYFSVFTATGSAQSIDQLLVVDDAGIFDNRIGEVETTANNLITRGADVRIRTILTYGTAGDLDQYEAQLERQSPSWITQNGDTKSNLIVLIIALQERKVGLYYGSYWAKVLDSNWERIQTDIMIPLFQEGDYAGGTINGLEEIQRLIKGQGQTAAGTQTLPQAATGNSKGWIIPLLVLIILGLIIGLFFFYYYRRNRARRLAARQRAMLTKQAAASGINDLIENTQMLEIKVNVTADKMTPDEAVTLRNGLGKAKVLVDRSSQAYSELSHSAGDPENPKLGEAELGAIEPEYQKILSNLHEAQEAVNGVEEQINGYQQTVESFSGKVNEVYNAIERALSQQEDVKKAGFKSTFTADLIAGSRITLGQAKDLAAKKRLSEGLKLAVLAEEQIKQAIRAMEELPQKKQEAEAAIPALSTRIEQVKDTINKGRDIFDKLIIQYAELNWESVRGNGTEAENRVNWALDALDNARAATVMEQQEWHQALELVEKGNTWLTEAESLVKSISELEVNLIAARRDAPYEINAAQADVTKAWEYINTYDEDIRESLEDDLRTAEKKNELAREELRQEKPDYFKVCKLAREANEAADKILIQARDEHEAAERLRAKATSTRRDAGAKVSITRKFMEDHHPVIQHEAKNYLDNAIESLRQADTASDINIKIALAEKAEAAADQAYSLAHRDVNETTKPVSKVGVPPIIIIPTTGHSSGGDRSWGSRRSSSSSGSTIRRSGGGSSSWGSRSGGSSGWGSRSSGSGGSSRGGGSRGW